MEQQGKIYFTYSVATTRALMLSTFNMILLLSELYEMCTFLASRSRQENYSQGHMK